MKLTSLRQLTKSELPTLLQVLSGRAAGGLPNPAADHYEVPISQDDLVDLKARLSGRSSKLLYPANTEHSLPARIRHVAGETGIGKALSMIRRLEHGFHA